MIKEKNKGIIIVISGPSGAGKGSICKRIVEEMEDVKISVSMTSRNPRETEKEGVDYYFVTKEAFEEKIAKDEFLEYAIVHGGNYYGTPKSSIEELINNGINVILEIDIQGALKIKELIKDAIFIFIMPPSMKELKNRLIKRNTETKESMLERFKTAYKELNEYKKYNYVVANDELEVAVNKVKSIIISEKCRVDRIEEIFLSSSEEEVHEELIGKNFDNSERVI